jgi:predicted dehydrogenase
MVTGGDAAMRIGVVGAGFWATFQTAAWREVSGAEVVAISDRGLRRAEELAEKRGISAVYASADELLATEQPDVLDIVTAPDAHAALVRIAAAAGVAIICQKPLAPSLRQAEDLVRLCARAGVPLLVHENFRWQTTIRALKAALDAGVVGRPFRARLSFCTSFPVFANQPGLRELDQLIVADLGVHLLDVARFLFGEVRRVYCETARVTPQIAGEDVATIVLTHESGVTCVCELSFASVLEPDPFPETLAVVEAERGSLELAPQYVLRVTTCAGTVTERHRPPSYDWADPAYAVVHASMVPCLNNLVDALRGGAPAETTGADNLQSLRLAFAAYESADRGQAVEHDSKEPY